MHVTYALIKAYDGTLTFQHCLRNLQQIHFNVSMHRDFVVAARNIWPPCTFENQIVSTDRILLAICRNNKGEGNGGVGGSITSYNESGFFCFGPRYVDALSPLFHVPVVILSPPVRIHTYEQPVISAETVYCLTFARALFYVLTGNRRIAGFIKWFVMRMSLLTSQRYVGGIFC